MPGTRLDITIVTYDNSYRDVAEDGVLDKGLSKKKRDMSETKEG